MKKSGTSEQCWGRAEENRWKILVLIIIKLHGWSRGGKIVKNEIVRGKSNTLCRARVRVPRTVGCLCQSMLTRSEERSHCCPERWSAARGTATCLTGACARMRTRRNRV